MQLNYGHSIQTAEKIKKHVKKFLKESFSLTDSEKQSLIFSVSKFYANGRAAKRDLTLISKAYRLLIENNRNQEAIFLYLNFSLRLSARSLYLLRFEDFSESQRTLKTVSSNPGQLENIKLDQQTCKVLKEFRDKRNLSVQSASRSLPGGKDRVEGPFIFNHKPAYFNKKYQNGFGKLITKFNLTPSKVKA